MVDPANEPGSRGPRGPHLDEEACAELVAGLLSSAARLAALEHLRSCPDCEARFRLVGGDWEQARARRAPAGWQAAGIAPVMRSPGPIRPRSGRNLWRIVVPLGVAAALCTIVLQLERSRHPNPCERCYWMPLTVQLQQLRTAGTSGSDSAFWEGLTAYRSHDARRAVRVLEVSRTSGGFDDLRRLYLASARINAGRPADGVHELESLRIDTLPMPWREDALWMKYLALKAVRRRSEAEALLDRMASWPGHIGDLARGERSEQGHP